MPPRPATPGDTGAEEHFSREAAAYDHASTTGLWAWWRGHERRAIWRLLRPSAGERILDAGCGAGYYSEHLLRSGAEVTATDLSPSMALQARRRLAVPAFAANLEQVALRGTFDAVLCAGALEFCPHPARAISRLAMLIDPGRGRLVLMLPSASVPGALYRQYHRGHGLEIRLFSRSWLQRLADARRLRVTGWGTIGFNHVVRLERGGAAR